jgi:hypothetical protein
MIMIGERRPGVSSGRWRRSRLTRPALGLGGEHGQDEPIENREGRDDDRERMGTGLAGKHRELGQSTPDVALHLLAIWDNAGIRRCTGASAAALTATAANIRNGWKADITCSRLLPFGFFDLKGPCRAVTIRPRTCVRSPACHARRECSSPSSQLLPRRPVRRARNRPQKATRGWYSEAPAPSLRRDRIRRPRRTGCHGS